MERNEIAKNYTWDLSSIFSDDEAFLAALSEAKNYPEQFEALKGHATGSPQALLAFLRLDDEADITLGKLSNYASRKSDEDTRVALYQDYEAQVHNLIVSIIGSYSWFRGELLALGSDRMEEYYQQEPNLELYRRALGKIFRTAPHTLSPAEEQLLAKASDMAHQPENIFSLFNDADLTFPDAIDCEGEVHPVTHGTYVPLLMSADRTLRRSAYESLYGVYRQFSNTSAAVLGAQAKQLKFFSEARHYPTALEAALDANEVPTAVYDQLIEAVHNHLPALHRYVDLRKRLLQVDDLHYYDLYVPVVSDIDMHFTYEEACDLILRALEPMGEDYLAIVRQGLSQRWVDVFENPGKRSGAYSAGGFDMHPVILMNFQGTLDDVFTLIHEMGHSVHTYLSCQNQPSRYSDYVIFVAEVASTCNESLLMRYLLDHAKNPRERAYLLNHFLEQFRGTVYRQTMFAEFEREVGRLCAAGAGITAEALCQIYGDLNATYYGPNVAMDKLIPVEWSRIPHFYYRYYVYQYATGFSAAIALSSRILELGSPAVADYLAFLKGGCSLPPIDLLRGAGVDMSTSAPVDAALDLFSALVDELAEISLAAPIK